MSQNLQPLNYAIFQLFMDGKIRSAQDVIDELAPDYSDYKMLNFKDVDEVLAIGKENGLLDEKMLWENTFIKHQIDKRNRNEHFTISDHIRGMVYSMLSSGIAWSKLKNGIDTELIIDSLKDAYNLGVLNVKKIDGIIAKKLKEDEDL